MREYLKDHARLLIILLVMCGLLVPALPMAVTVVSPDTVEAVGEAWLSDYLYRRAITITGSTAGVQTDYVIPMTVLYEEEIERGGVPTGFTWLEGWYEPNAFFTGGHSQGAESDGTYLWWSGGSRLVRTSVADPDWDNPLADNPNVLIQGTQVLQINGIHKYGDLIYATGIVFPYAAQPSLPYRCFVKEYDALTLEYEKETELFWTGSDGVQEGIAFEQGYWWTISYDFGVVAQYDDGFNFLSHYSLPGVASATQGHDWIDGQLWIQQNGEQYTRIYDWSGSAFSLNTTVSLPSEVVYPQSFGITPDGRYMYMGGFTITDPGPPEDITEDIHKMSIAWEVGGGEAGLYLNLHSQTDFDDIRFTASDGDTELDYFMDGYVASDTARFFVEVPTIAASPSTTTIYMYYGNAGASTTSDITSLGAFGDDAETGAPTDKWTEDGLGGFATYSVAEQYAGAKSMEVTDTGGEFVKFTLGSTITNFALSYHKKADALTLAQEEKIVDGSANQVTTFQWRNNKELRWYDGGAWNYTTYDYTTDWELHETTGVASTDVIVWEKDGVEIAYDAHRAAWLNFEWFGMYSTDQTFYIDNVFLREISDPEPTITAYGSEVTEGEGETPPGYPNIETLSPIDVTDTTMTLRGNVEDIGDTSIAYWGFVWDTESHSNPGDTALDSTAYANYWEEATLAYEDPFDHEITDLTEGQLIYYRAGARNNQVPTEEWGYGVEWTSAARPDPPYSFNATTISASQIDLAWTRGEGSEGTLIMRRAGLEPTLDDGEEAYQGTASTYSDDALDAGIHYYYGAWSYAGDWKVFSETPATADNTTLTGFSVRTEDATDITLTSATLQGTLVDDAGEVCSLRFVWGDPPGYTGGSTVWMDGYETGASYFETIVDLVPDNQYHYRIEAKHADQTTELGGDKVFTTLSGPPGVPLDFVASFNGTQVNLSWTKGARAVNTLIRYATDGYPVDTEDGEFLYLGTASAYPHASLETGVVYYYSAWSMTNGIYSLGKATATAPLVITSVRVFSDFLETGDQLYTLSYRLFVPTIYEPQDPRSFFNIQITDNTSTILKQVKLEQWGYMPASIYVSAAEALTWGGDYAIRIIGINGTYFEGTFAEHDLQDSDWIGGDLTYLDDWVIATARDMEAYYGVTLVFSSGSDTVLYEQGEVTFDTGIPYLKEMRPHLFATFEGTNPPEIPLDYDETFQEGLEGGMGDSFTNMTEGIAPLIGQDAKTTGLLLWVIFAGVGAMVTVGFTRGNILAGGLLAIGIMIAGASQTGYLDVQWVALALACLAAILVKVFWLR